MHSGARMASAFALCLFACTSDLPSHVELKPAAENVEIVLDAPGPGAYALIGEVTGRAAANDVDVAEHAAQNDLRNKAAALGASVVTVDETLGEAVLLTGMTKVTLIGRAYRATD
jgi:hypothetical protein